MNQIPTSFICVALDMTTMVYHQPASLCFSTNPMRAILQSLHLSPWATCPLRVQLDISCSSTGLCFHVQPEFFTFIAILLLATSQSSNPCNLQFFQIYLYVLASVQCQTKTMNSLPQSPPYPLIKHLSACLGMLSSYFLQGVSQERLATNTICAIQSHI